VQPFVDVVGLVQVRIIDEALPAHRRTRLLKIDTHHHFEISCVFLTQFFESMRILHGACRIMDGAGASDHEQAVIRALHDGISSESGLLHKGTIRVLER
jgi:cobaltochelatase CobN